MLLCTPRDIYTGKNVNLFDFHIRQPLATVRRPSYSPKQLPSHQHVPVKAAMLMDDQVRVWMYGAAPCKRHTTLSESMVTCFCSTTGRTQFSFTYLSHTCSMTCIANSVFIHSSLTYVLPCITATGEGLRGWEFCPFSPIFANSFSLSLIIVFFDANLKNELVLSVAPTATPSARPERVCVLGGSHAMILAVARATKRREHLLGGWVPFVKSLQTFFKGEPRPYGLDADLRVQGFEPAVSERGDWCDYVPSVLLYPS